MFKLLTSIAFLILFTFTAFAQQKERVEYVSILAGYNTQTAEKLHDSTGTTTFNNDPDDNGSLIGFGYAVVLDSVSKEYRFITESEFTYNFGAKPSIITGFNVTVETTTKSLMQNFYYDKYINDKLFLRLGAGLGMSRSTVETDFSGESVTFKGEYENNLKFAYQGLAGIGMDINEKTLISLVYKHSNHGEIRGASGSQSDGSAYLADEFDHVYDTFLIQVSFKY